MAIERHAIGVGLTVTGGKVRRVVIDHLVHAGTVLVEVEPQDAASPSRNGAAAVRT